MLGFIVVRSPKGGKLISGLWAGVRTAKNCFLQPEKTPSVAGDYLAWKIGYAEDELHRGDPILIKRSDAKHLLDVLRDCIV